MRKVKTNNNKNINNNKSKTQLRRMRNHFEKWSRYSSRMVYLLAACGLMYSSCKDEYTLDDEKPDWLNSSIYQSLQSKRNFSTYLRLLSDKDVNPENVRPLSDVLNQTGSKTVFVADDDAWKEFFKKNAQLPESNPWHYATSYERLSPAQKKLLIHTSMLNNAIVMENLASSESSGTARPVRGEYLRRYTDVELTDSVSFVAGSEIPHSYNTHDTDFWKRFRPTEENPEGRGIYLVNDATPSMMIHFTSEQMAKNSVTDEDFAKFMGRERVTSDVYIYDAKLLEKDGVCENGYVNVTEKPLCPLANMAEVIRTNGKTNIFSHMLDRFSAPYYQNDITRAYKTLHPEFEDSIFAKRYFSDLSYGHFPNSTQPDGEPYVGDMYGAVSLKFDPGWNGYYDEVAAEKDMASMFVPSDKAMWQYFTEGGGLQLIDTYGDPTLEYGNDVEKLYQNIDSIPLSTLQALINIIMLRSFNGSVPSKMTKLRDDAQEQLFYAEDVEKIDTCLLASNGAVYIMNDIYGPADYTSVTSPAYISRSNLVTKWAIYNGSVSGQTDHMGLNYYAYLKAMQSEFTFFLPSDSALQYYYDPTSFESTQKRMIALKYKEESFPIESKTYKYDPETGVIGDAINGTGGYLNNAEITNRLKDILESHTIVHDGTNPINGEDEYFLAKNGSAIKVTRDENNHIIKVQGGFQVQNEKDGIKTTISSPGLDACNVTKPFEGLKNGQTYILDAPIIPTYRSVFSILTLDGKQKFTEGIFAMEEEEALEKDPYVRFYELCETNADIVKACGLVNEKELSATEQNSALKKYNIFVDAKGLDFNVQFFNNYRYTLFAPTNKAVEKAIANGLPTWAEIQEDYENTLQRNVEIQDSLEAAYSQYGYVMTDDDELRLKTVREEAAKDSVRLQAKITYLVNFVRYHFADNSVFADKSELPENEMVTSSYDSDLGLFCKIIVDRVKQGGETVLRVRDNNGGEMMPTVGEKNVLARDVECSTSPVGVSMKLGSSNITMDASSSTVIHQIDGTLNHTKLVNGRHDSTWATTASAKKYLQRYAIIQ